MGGSCEMNFKVKLITLLCLILLGIFVVSLPWKRQSTALTQILYSWGEEQEENSDQITSSAVNNVEGGLVGQHQVDGSNWSIPNILRHLLRG